MGKRAAAKIGVVEAGAEGVAEGTAEAGASRAAAPGAERVLGPETARSQQRRLAEGFIDRYLSGGAVLDIGYRGGKADAQPVTEKAIGVELDYPGYDGVRLPFEDCSQDAVFASHTLEHIDDYRTVLADWFRVLKIGGYLVIAVPHQYLYERKANLPSRFNGNHKRFYTPASLLREIEEALPAGGFRVRTLRDIDDGFGYSVPPERHAKGCYEIELVIQKIEMPAYADRLVPQPEAAQLTRFFGDMVTHALAARDGGHGARVAAAQAILAGLPLPPFRQLEKTLAADLRRTDLMAIMRPIIEAAPFDEAFYLERYADVRRLVEAGRLASGKEHFTRGGYFEGRFVNTFSLLYG